MAEHWRDGYGYCVKCVALDEEHEVEGVMHPCLPYRLADALATEPDRTRAAVAKALDEAASDPMMGSRARMRLRARINAIESGADFA